MELQIVSKPEDEAEFEMHTNRDFNKSFDADVVTSGALQVKPILLSRAARRAQAKKKTMEAPIDERKVR